MHEGPCGLRPSYSLKQVAGGGGKSALQPSDSLFSPMQMLQMTCMRMRSRGRRQKQLRLVLQKHRQKSRLQQPGQAEESRAGPLLSQGGSLRRRRRLSAKPGGRQPPKQQQQ